MTDLILSGNTSKTYLVTVLSTDGTSTVSGAYNLTIKNPCIDINFIEIATPVVMPDYIKYKLTEGFPVGIAINAASLLSINTKPNSSNVCMEGISYEVYFDGQPVTPDSQPAWTTVSTATTYNSGFYTEDSAMIGIH